jgi:hypothetical protein
MPDLDTVSFTKVPTKEFDEPDRIAFDVKEPTVRDGYGPLESRRILKNLFGLGLCFTLIFTAYMAMVNLQSSINSEVLMSQPII